MGCLRGGGKAGEGKDHSGLGETYEGKWRGRVVRGNG